MADQMVQAARSGRQNIAEGSRASITSSQTELRLVNVARSSLDELLLDYEDYLRHRHLARWATDSSEALAVRQVPQRVRELLAAKHMQHRSARKKDPADPADRSDPADHIPICPQCGKPMALRTAKTGKNEGKQFWGCTAYRDCKGVVNL